MRKKSRVTRPKTTPKRTNAAIPALLGLAILLVLPGLALHRQGVDLTWAGAYMLFVSVLAFWIYAVDKRRAEQGLWRIPEAQLHALELLGGWPGAFLAQRVLRHKNAKLSYQAVFWLIVVAYQFAAIDSLEDWRYSRAAINAVYQQR